MEQHNILLVLQNIEDIRYESLTINGIDFYNIDFVKVEDDYISGYAEDGWFLIFQVKINDITSIKATEKEELLW